MSQALYQRIAGSLRARILSGGHPVGDVLPSENELADAYRTSRVTVRKAFQILESEGLIKARQGKGYIVQPPRHSTFTLIFGAEAEQGAYRDLEVSIVPPELPVSRMLALGDGQLVISIRRVLERGGLPAAFDEKFIPYERGKPTVEQELEHAEFPELFAGRFVTVSLRTEMSIRASSPPDYVRRALDTGDEQLLTVERLILSPEGQRIGFSREWLTGAFGPLRAVSGPPTGG